MTRTIVAFSGGKDSTEMALRMRELGEDFDLFFTPTGDELPELFDHLHHMEQLLGQRIITPRNRTLEEWIYEYKGLPNWRQRWCTRLIKILPCQAYLKAHPGSTLCVGLRHDEPLRSGLYGSFATYRYPLREWGWNIGDVKRYVAAMGVDVPARTDCACCFFQRIIDWYNLWLEHPAEYARSEGYETLTGYTFRSAQRDTWPAGLRELREEFERGRKPRGLGKTPNPDACRVCRL